MTRAQGRQHPAWILRGLSTAYPPFLLVAALFASASVAVLSCTAAAQPEPCRLGLEAQSRGDSRAAIAGLTECLKLNLPPRARAFTLERRGGALLESNRPDEALADLKEALSLQPPEDVWPLVLLGAAHRELNQFDLALAALERAKPYDEDGPGSGPGMAVYYHTGKTYFSAGRYAQAIEALTTGIPKQPDYGYAFYERARSHAALGDRDAATRDMARAAELAPSEGYEPEIAAALAEYGFRVKVRDQ